MCSILVRSPITSILVVHVILACSKIQVIEVPTRPVITVMKDLLTSRDWPALLLPIPAMQPDSRPASAFWADVDIALGVGTVWREDAIALSLKRYVLDVLEP